ncbi:putative phosphoesterase [Meinhardsimonia xiamenensis]|jgi:DNA ligase-associated metallophosphoesterase|uniref:Putative phosphoesterase n=1 Tax=Meinhardsimonia xiamenensis TaxID=990712 RepID=A0A1G9CJB9_9RHOB|nr:ligase-associated DNA damage response endonuclease PdeM [Meinhardsimonia xiamenensis]PRX38344.1 putative phosphoesterase [Meinhardsimonia xiamenensis]SDK51594.1 putative phosphoesterase [Meinhardsimonia xiamenensis]
MSGHVFTLAGAALEARGSGALWWPERGILAVSDLHLGRSERVARLGGALLPPYESAATLARLEAEIAALAPRSVVCLGDSFDDDAAGHALDEKARLWLTRLMAGRSWTWIAGNHDPGPPALGGSHLAELPAPPLTFRHIARRGASGEVSGHYHPKARLALGGRSLTRPCFLVDRKRVILPAFGAYTGGLDCRDPALTGLMQKGALAILTGPRPHPIPMPRR